jgi:hypothetical protein
MQGVAPGLFFELELLVILNPVQKSGVGTRNKSLFILESVISYSDC